MTTVDTSGWDLLRQDLTLALKKDSSVVLADESRLLVKQLISFTPPTIGSSSNRAGTKTGSPARAADLKTGEAAITHDLSRVFTGVSDELLSTIGSAHGVQNIDAWLTKKDGSKVNLKWGQIDANGSGIKEFHRKNMNRRGRTHSLKKTRSGESWNAAYVVSFEDLAAYKAKLLSRIGRMKAAWASLYIQLGGSLPSWVTRHLPTPKGYAVNQIFTNNPSAEITNMAPGIGDFASDVRNALRAREQAMAKRLKLVISGYSKDVANGIRVQNKARRENVD